jgi:alcohol dehydrogenase/propanol-preferring alcohol dehydrogenase
MRCWCWAPAAWGCPASAWRAGFATWRPSSRNPIARSGTWPALPGPPTSSIPAIRPALKALVKATRGGAAAVVDFVGSGASFDFGYGALRKGGRMVCVGLIGGASSIVPAMIALKAVSIVGSYVGSLQELQELLALAQDGTLPPLPLNLRPLAQANQALDDLRAGKVRGRTVLQADAA